MFKIIATGYNCAEYISKCYYSILNQTNKNFEAILVDDGSTDNTGGMLKSLCMSDKIKFRSYKENKKYQDNIYNTVIQRPPKPLYEDH